MNLKYYIRLFEKHYKFGDYCLFIPASKIVLSLVARHFVLLFITVVNEVITKPVNVNIQLFTVVPLFTVSFITSK
jgi:hypothetical protein